MAVDRRGFLTALGGGGAAVLAGAGPAAALGGGSRSGRTTSSVDAWPTRARTSPHSPHAAPDWKALRRRLGSRLILPGDRGYAVQRLGFNELNDGQYPAAIARCASAADVQACLDVARGHGLPIAARSGGHSYLGYSVPSGGLVLDLRLMSQVQVRRDGTAVVGAGARLIEVYYALAAAGRLLPAGSCPTVGVSGLTLGGGIGVLARKYGLTCDRVAAAEVVTADSHLRTASPTSEPGLYWALRGGGGGNFGVVTEFTFRTEPAPGLTVFSLRFPSGSAAEVIGAWQHWIANAPFEMWASCQVSGGNPPTAHLVGCYVGGTTAANRLLDRLVSAAGVRPISRSVVPKSYLGAMKYMAGCSNDSLAQCHPVSEGGRLPRESFVAVSRMLGSRPLDAGRVTDLMHGHTGVDLLLDSLGGAVSQLRPDATAFPHRDSLASAQIYAGTTSAGRRQATRTVDGIRDGLARLGATGAYVNYIDAGLPDWGHAYYGANLPRLKSVAHQYDPDGVFAFRQSVTRG
ncbi:FAD-binding oxidoreductase [Streptacidiphilus jiangxiensis]|uniref:FAD/FMN-containing dehydrogenase n=1 Tax=Streptacidiphilus jiangxiensis TaxID=235985 RepID=A0A1H7MU19_STRJI|nr:FAD-binding oxidoreductase [Streptacidiphilus jiangxiensis]SEL14762.1 FAD/FMN-containing dehydrogenase [Streptacidiphilus jiangxiensis]